MTFLKRDYNLGIIPTRVGTRGAEAYGTGRQKDHPHACGDKCESGYNIAVFAGSSPRVWGQDLDSKYYIWHCRIIPTRVGTSSPFGAEGGE